MNFHKAQKQLPLDPKTLFKYISYNFSLNEIFSKDLMGVRLLILLRCFHTDGCLGIFLKHNILY